MFIRLVINELFLCQLFITVNHKIREVDISLDYNKIQKHYIQLQTYKTK